MEPDDISAVATKKAGNTKKFLAIIGAAIFLGCLIFLVMPDNSFAAPGYVSISRGETLEEIAQSLHTSHIISSEFIFKSFIELLGKEKKIIPGDYYFKSAPSTFEIVSRISSGNFGVEQVKVTFPEGMTRYEMAKLLTTKYVGFSIEGFLDLTKNKEGYLFPNTYFFSPIATPESIALRMEQEFDTETLSLKSGNQSHTWSDVVTMASIVEAEAGGDDDRAIIAGILWKRLDDGMRLQVDAPFAYILHKTSAELTLNDLALNSPYNTYLHTGLPPTPIGNPGLQALSATVSPEVSTYFFYLHDKEGTIHYARTFTEHKANIAKYLN